MRRLARVLRPYLTDPELPAGPAAAVLRGAFVAAFGLQAAFALGVGASVRVAFGASGASGGGLQAAVLVAFAAFQLGVGAFVARLGVRATRRAAEALRADAGGASDSSDSSDAADARARLRSVRSGALAQAVLAAVLLATPIWFTAFAAATGQGLAALAALGGLAALGYGVGIVACGGLARAAATRRPDAD